MIDRFPGLRHDAVVGRHDQHDDVGDLGAAGAHHRERGVAGRVEEHDALAGLLAGAHQVGADVLRDAAGFAFGDAGLADRVEQRRLAVIDVAHDRDDRPARDQVLRIGGLVALGGDFLFEAARFDLGAEAGGERLRGFEIDRRVDGHHHAAIEQRLQRVLDADFEAIGEILHRHAFGERDGARDRRRRGRRGRLLRTLQRIALLRRLQAGRAMLLLRAEARPHRRLTRTLRHAGRRAHRLRGQRTRTAEHRRGVALRRTRLSRTDADPAGARDCRSRPAADAAAQAARRAAAAARLAASVAAAARSAAPCRVLRRAGECSAARSGRPFRARPPPVRRWRLRRLRRLASGSARPALRLGDRSGRFFDRRRVDGRRRGRLDRRRHRLVGLRLGRPRLLDQSRRTERRRGRLRRLRRRAAAPFLPGAALPSTAVLACLTGLLREHVALRQGDALLLGQALDELAGDDLFERA